MHMGNRVFVFVMTALMVLASPLQSVALAEVSGRTGKYLSEAYVSVAPTAAEAARKLEEKGYNVLKKDGKPADLNQGAGSALKESRAVVLGYKTTDDSAAAITDLAAMNMNGGYSVSSYRDLVRKYRDSTISPFVQRFMTTIAEYRENLASKNAGNRAKAEFMRSLLNRVVDDDTGGRLGDLLAQQTKAEMGDEYLRISEEKQKTHIDLERALLVGNVNVVLRVEQLLSYAADAADTTWLQRLSAMGSSGFEAQQADMRPSDALNQQAARYQDVATSLAQGWNEVRDKLLAYDQRLAEESNAGGVTGNEGTGVVDLPDQAPAQPNAVVQQEDDEVDVSERVRLEIPEDAGDAREVSPSDVPEVLNEATDSLEAMNEVSEDVDDTNTVTLYSLLKSLPYDGGTLYDLFTLPRSEVTGDNISKLYPAASCLSAGQVAAIEFLPLPALLQIGATTGESYEKAWADGLGLTELVDATGDVSLYQGVNRDMFSDVTALTSDAMRADALRHEGAGVFDFLSQYKELAFFWCGAVVSGILAGFSVCRDVKGEMRHAAVSRLEKTVEDIKGMYKKAQLKVGDRYNDASITIEALTDAPKDKAFKVTVTRTRGLNPLEREEALRRTYDFKDIDGILRIDDVTAQLEKVQAEKTTGSVTKYFSKDSGLEAGTKNYHAQVKKLEERCIDLNEKNPRVSWGSSVLISGLFLFFAAKAIFGTIEELQAYYNVKYAPMPRYMVDVVDITVTGDDGTSTFIRNDTAYYSAVLTNAPRTGEDFVALVNYADLNGDVGKQWLALYSAKGKGDPILADSLMVVTGTSSVPFGYSTGIHMFGSDTAFNLTDSRYCYNDKADGVYTYFRRDSGAASNAASVFRDGSTALVGGVCLMAGAAIGAGGMYLVGKRRKEPATV